MGVQWGDIRGIGLAAAAVFTLYALPLGLMTAPRSFPVIAPVFEGRASEPVRLAVAFPAALTDPVDATGPAREAPAPNPPAATQTEPAQEVPPLSPAPHAQTVVNRAQAAEPSNPAQTVTLGADTVAASITRLGRPVLLKMDARPAPRLARRAPKGRNRQRPKRRSSRRCGKKHPEIRPHQAQSEAFDIDRSLIRRYTGDLNTFLKLGFSKPWNKDGVRGWYISGFSCNSPLWAAGLRRGDILLSVNGRKTRSWAQVYFVYLAMKSKSEIDLAVMRRGEPMNLHYTVIEPEPSRKPRKRRKRANQAT